jgi:hypothetical protein
MSKYPKGVSRGVHNIAITVSPDRVSIVQYRKACKKSRRLHTIIYCRNKHNRAKTASCIVTDHRSDPKHLTDLLIGLTPAGSNITGPVGPLLFRHSPSLSAPEDALSDYQ